MLCAGMYRNWTCATGRWDQTVIDHNMLRTPAVDNSPPGWAYPDPLPFPQTWPLLMVLTMRDTNTHTHTRSKSSSDADDDADGLKGNSCCQSSFAVPYHSLCWYWVVIARKRESTHIFLRYRNIWFYWRPKNRNYTLKRDSKYFRYPAMPALRA